MDEDKLRKADFKTGLVLIAFCVWFLSITFIFMPFRQTYGGVENAWYVSPWIFPAIVLSLLLLLSVILTVNAARRDGFRDVVEFPEATLRSLRLTAIGTLFVMLLIAACGAGLWYLIVNIEDKIQASIADARWLADPSLADIFSWTDPRAVVPLALLPVVLVAAIAVLVVSARNHHREVGGQRAPQRLSGPSELTVRFAIIALLFAELVYLLVPNVDFFISMLLFLTVFTTTFHVGGKTLSRASMGTYLALGLAVALVFPTGLDRLVNAGYRYTSDFAVLAATLGYMVWAWRFVARDPVARGKLRTCLLIAWAAPLIVAPVFRFGLLVPLPHEGAVIELMQRLRYLLY